MKIFRKKPEEKTIEKEKRGIAWRGKYPGSDWIFWDVLEDDRQGTSSVKVRTEEGAESNQKDARTQRTSVDSQ